MRIPIRRRRRRLKRNSRRIRTSNVKWERKPRRIMRSGSRKKRRRMSGNTNLSSLVKLLNNLLIRNLRKRRVMTHPWKGTLIQMEPNLGGQNLESRKEAKTLS